MQFYNILNIWPLNDGNDCAIQLRPDITDFLFLRYFPDPFHFLERNNNKTKGKTGKTLHENTKFVENCLFLKNYFMFPVFFSTFFNDHFTVRSEKQQID